jgi:hypothetical protein
MTNPEDWAPDACTLPTAERPLRVAEFDELLSKTLQCARPRPTLLELVIPGHDEAAARDLAARETECCAFFSFDFEPVGDDVVMHIGVPASRIDVLDALEARIAR